AVGLGIYLAHRFYRQRREEPAPLGGRVSVGGRVWGEKNYVDELYTLTVGRPDLAAWRRLHALDPQGVGGIGEGGLHVTVGLSHVSRFFDQYAVDGTVNAIAYLTRGLSLAFRRVQTGMVQAYLSIFVFGIFLFVSFYLFWQR